VRRPCRTAAVSTVALLTAALAVGPTPVISIIGGLPKSLLNAS